MKAIDVTRLRERRVFQGRKFEARPALFPGYCFVLMETAVARCSLGAPARSV